MGLDVVELVMDVEEAFEVQIPDEDYADLRTVGNLYEYIIAKKSPPIEQPARPRVCLTTAAFALLRPAFVSLAGVERRSVRPATSVDELSPSWRRRDDWDALRNLVSLELPELRRPSRLVAMLSAMAVGIVMSVIYWLTFILPAVIAWMFGLAIVAPLLARALVRATEPCATLLPANCDTVGGLSRVVLARNLRALQERYQGWGEGDVWGTLCGIISEQLGVPLEEITYESRFVEDLGAN